MLGCRRVARPQLGQLSRSEVAKSRVLEPWGFFQIGPQNLEKTHTDNSRRPSLKTSAQLSPLWEYMNRLGLAVTAISRGHRVFPTVSTHLGGPIRLLPRIRARAFTPELATLLFIRKIQSRIFAIVYHLCTSLMELRFAPCASLKRCSVLLNELNSVPRGWAIKEKGHSTSSDALGTWLLQYWGTSRCSYIGTPNFTDSAFP